VRRIPVTTCKWVYEEKVEQCPIRVCRMEAYQKTIRVPRTVCRRVPVTYTCYTPRVVCCRIPVDACGVPLETVPADEGYLPQQPSPAEAQPEQGKPAETPSLGPQEAIPQPYDETQPQGTAGNGDLKA